MSIVQIGNLFISEAYPHRRTELNNAARKIISAISDIKANSSDAVIFITGKLFEYTNINTESMEILVKFLKKFDEIPIYILDPDIDKVMKLVEIKNVYKLEAGQLKSGVLGKFIEFGIHINIHDIYATQPPTHKSDGICILLTRISEIKKIDRTKFHFCMVPEYCESNTFSGPGNLVQRNKQDELSGAFCVWHIKQHTKEIVHIFPRTGFLTLYIVNENGSAKTITKYRGYDSTRSLPDVEPVYVEVIGDDPEQLDDIRAKYGNIDKITRFVHESADSLNEIDVLSEYLERRVSDEVRDMVLEMHRAKKHDSLKKIRYFRINYIEFENILCFRRGHINFDKKLMSLNGPNKSGKSAILDIINMILFNVCSRFDKKDMIKSGCQGGKIMSVITGVTGEKNSQYMIERYIGNKENVKFINLETGSDLTRPSISETYINIGDIVGTYEDFIGINVAMQNRTLFSDMKTGDIQNFVLKHIGVNDFDDLHSEIKSEYKQVKTKIDTLRSTLVKVDEPSTEKSTKDTKTKGKSDKEDPKTGKPVTPRMHSCSETGTKRDKETSFGDRLASLLETDKPKKKLDISESEDHSVDLIKTLEVEKELVVSKIAKFSYRNIELIKEAAEIRKKLGVDSSNRKQKHLLPDKLVSDKKGLESNIKETEKTLDTLKYLIDRNNLKVNKDFEPDSAQTKVLRKRVLELTGVDEWTLQNYGKCVSGINKLISQYEKQLKPFSFSEFTKLSELCNNKNVPPGLAEEEPEYIVYPKLSRKLDLELPELTKELKSLQDTKTTDYQSEISELSGTISGLKTKTTRESELSSEMSSALSKISSKIKKLQDKSKQTESATGGIKFSHNCGVCQSNKKILFDNNAKELAALTSELKDTESHYTGLINKEKIKKSATEAEIEKHKERLAELKTKQTEMRGTMTRMSALENDIKWFETSLLIVEQEKLKAAYKLRTNMRKLSELNTIKASNERIKSEIAELEKLSDFVRNNINSHFHATTHELEGLNKQLKVINTLIRLNEIETEIGTAEQDMSERELADLKKQLKEVDIKLSVAMSNSMNQERNKKIQGKIDKLLPKYEALKIYKQATGTRGIRATILSNVYPKLGNSMNAILSKISDTNLTFTFSGTVFKLTAVSGSIKSKIKTISGSQKFAIDIAFRLAMLDICKRSRIFIIDEGFGCLDQENLEVVRNTFAQISDKLDLMLIISHVPNITSMCHPITVSKEIEYGKKFKGPKYSKQYIIADKQIKIYCTKHEKTVAESHFEKCPISKLK